MTPNTYYLTVAALTPVSNGAEAIIERSNEVPVFPEFSDYTIYGPIFLFFAIFFLLFVILIVNRTRNLRRIFTSLIIAIVGASIPAALSVISNRSSLTQTKAGPDDIPRNVAVAELHHGKVAISWQTGAPRSGAVRISESPLRIANSRIFVSENGTIRTDHRVVVGELAKGKQYDFMILSGTEWYGLGNAPVTFTYGQ